MFNEIQHILGMALCIYFNSISSSPRQSFHHFYYEKHRVREVWESEKDSSELVNEFFMEIEGLRNL